MSSSNPEERWVCSCGKDTHIARIMVEHVKKTGHEAELIDLMNDNVLMRLDPNKPALLPQ